jgi:AbiV family abortive infection protein
MDEKFIDVKDEERAQAVKNALRLLDDAAYLADAERYPSAYYLAVVAAEELGKYVMIAWTDFEPDPALNNKKLKHPPKQSAFSAMLMADTLLNAFRKVVGGKVEMNAIDILETITSSALEKDLGRTVLKEIETDDHTALFAQSIYSGWQKMKHLALYSDVDPVLDRPPLSVTERELRLMIDAVERVLEMLHQGNMHVELALGVRKHYERPEVQAEIKELRNKDGISKARK